MSLKNIMKIFNYKDIPIKDYKCEGIYTTGKVDYESYYREHPEEMDNNYHPVDYADFSIDFLRELLVLNPEIDVRLIITYWWNDWKLSHGYMQMYDWVIQYRPELLEFFKVGIDNGQRT